MRNKAINALLAMGMPASIKGFVYIVDAMDMFHNEETRNGKIMNLYFFIAKNRNDSASNVERSMRHAFSRVIAKGNHAEVEKYLSMQNTTNANLLHTFYLRLEQENQENEN